MAAGSQKIVGILPNHYIHVLDLVSFSLIYNTWVTCFTAHILH